jgi:hypothetical protein
MTALGDDTQAPSELNSHRQQLFFCGSPPLPEPFGRRLSIVLSRRSQLAGVEQWHATSYCWPSCPGQLFQNIEARYWSSDAGQIAVFPGLCHASGEDRRRISFWGQAAYIVAHWASVSTRHVTDKSTNAVPPPVDPLFHQLGRAGFRSL